MKRWEKGLIAASAVTFFGALYLYASDYPLYRYIFGIDEEGALVPVGKVQEKSGVLRRQVIGEAGFKSIEDGGVLYNSDTVVTSSDAKAMLSFDDGSSLELEPSTMVRLKFVSTLALGGISRAPRVDVFSGVVKAQAAKQAIVIRSGGKVTQVARQTSQRAEAPKAKPILASRVPLPEPAAAPSPEPVVLAAVPSPSPVAPSPSPIPAPAPVLVKLELLSPKSGTQLSVERDARALEKTVSASWNVSPPDTRVQVTLWKLAGGSRQSIFSQVMEASPRGLGEARQVIRSPGSYEWEVRAMREEKLASGSKTRAMFELSSEVELIELMEPLVGGMPASSNQIQEKVVKNFDITLRWQPRGELEKYIVSIKNASKAKKAVLERSLTATEYVFNKDQVYSGEIFYQVRSPLKNGFVAVSPERPFAFVFLAPLTVAPKDGAILDKTRVAAEGGSVLFTWEKTNFTEFYEIEIARDPEFRKRVVKEKRNENFYVLKQPSSGTYYWRVKSFAKNVLSPPSRAARVIVDLTEKP